MNENNPEQIKDDFDWGFSAVTLDELEVIQETRAKLEESGTEAEKFRTRCEKVYNSIQPLLNNLRANPDRDYLYWPDRLAKIEQFSEHLDAIFHGEK